MKKTLAFIASLVLMTTAFVSCGDTDDDDNSSSGRRSKSSSSVDRSDDDEDDEDDNKSSKKDKDDEDDDDDDKKSSKKDKNDDDDKDDKKLSENDKDDDDDDDSKPSKKSDNDITGVWIPDEAAMEEFFGDMGDEFVLESMTFEFTENEIMLEASVDMSNFLCVDGDKFVIYGESMDYDYDGKVITLSYMGETLAEFERVGKADKDSVYGVYSCDDMFNDIEEAEYTLDFPEDNVCYLVISGRMKCSYDEKAGKITITDMEGEVSECDVEISGDKMIMTDEEGEISFKRK